MIVALRDVETGTSVEDICRNRGGFDHRRQRAPWAVRSMTTWLSSASSHRLGKSRQLSMLLKRFVATTGLLLLVGCGHNPEGPSGPPPVGTVTLTCPADVHVQNVSAATSVNFPVPAASGGVSPVSTTCAPGSGSLFPVGSTTVTCTGTDSAMPARSGVCSFVVTLPPAVPVLKATTFLALGDSLTLGENGLDGPDFPCTMTSSAPRPLFVNGCNTYPQMLQNLLDQRYTSQEPTVANRGVRLETTGGGLARLPGLISETHPDALLVLEGINDFTQTTATDIIPNLRADIQVARNAGLTQVFLSTLLPQKPGSRSMVSPQQIQSTNGQIRALAMEQNVPLVDNEAAFLAVGDYCSLIEDDGLHATPAGYQLIAQTFFTAIKANLEQTLTGVQRVGAKGPVLSAHCPPVKVCAPQAQLIRIR